MARSLSARETARLRRLVRPERMPADVEGVMGLGLDDLLRAAYRDRLSAIKREIAGKG